MKKRPETMKKGGAPERRAAPHGNAQHTDKSRKETAAAKGVPASGAAAPLPEQSEAAAQLKALAGEKLPTIVVLGGGAAGMAAAIAAVRTAHREVRTLRVVLLEKADRVGRKLLATGNGRCNLGHEPITPENYVAMETSAAAHAARTAFLAARQPGGAAALLRELGLLIREEEGRLYPYCGQASMVLDVLRAALDAAGVVTVCGCGVTELVPVSGGFLLKADDGRNALPTLFAERVVLACGGAAAPKLGGCRDGYALAKQLGHSCTPLAPALVGLRCAVGSPEDAGAARAELLPGLKGIRAQATAALYDGDALLCADTGEVQFNENGLSGIPVLQLSLRLPLAKRPNLRLDLLPQLSGEEAAQLVRERCATGVPLEGLLLGTIHRKLGYAVMKSVGLGQLSRRSDLLTAPEQTRLAGCLKSWPITVNGHQGWDGAQVTAGGVPLTECDPDSCASRRCAGLYLAGEVLDCTGECGGFNLDWAFTTGARAGAAAARL